MNKAEKEILAEVLGTTLNMPADKVESLFKVNDTKSDEFDLITDAKKTILDANVERVKTFKEKETAEFQKGFKKAKAEERTTFEKEIKEAFPEFKSDKIGLELINELVTSKAKAPELEVDKVKLHPEFLNLEKSLNKKLVDAEAAWKKKFEDREAELADAQTFSEFLKESHNHLKKLNPILPGDEKKKANQLSLLEKDLKNYKFTKNKDEIIVTDKEGKRIEDEHGKPISHEALVAKLASEYWDFADGEDISGSGASNDAAAKAAAAKAAGSAKKWTKPVPKSDAEYSDIFPTLNAEDRILMTEAYEASRQVTT